MSELLLLGVLLCLWLLLSGGVRAAEPEEADDDALVRLAQGGDRHAFNRLVGRYQKTMYNVAYRVMGDVDRATDATQDAFITAYRKLHQYNEGNFRAWLSRIVTNQCYDTLRYEKRRPAASLDALLLTPDDPVPALAQDAPARPEELTLQGEVAEWMQQVILQLPPDQRITLVMADVHEYSYEEIAQATGVELGTVKSRLARARRKVRDLLQEKSELLPHRYRL